MDYGQSDYKAIGHQPPLLPTHHVTGSKNNPQKSDVKSYFKYIFKKYNNNNNIIIIELCDIL